jgi:hypothetical protein
MACSRSQLHEQNKKRKTAKKPSPKETCLTLLVQERADFALPADYRDGKRLDSLIKAVIDKIRTQHTIKKLRK